MLKEAEECINQLFLSRASCAGMVGELVVPV